MLKFPSFEPYIPTMDESIINVESPRKIKKAVAITNSVSLRIINPLHVN